VHGEKVGEEEEGGRTAQHAVHADGQGAPESNPVILPHAERSDCTCKQTFSLFFLRAFLSGKRHAPLLSKVKCFIANMSCLSHQSSPPLNAFPRQYKK